MSYDLKSYDPSNHRVELVVKHSTPGPEGTTIDTELTLHLAPRMVEPADRVSVLHLDLRWVTAPTVPDAALELARVGARGGA